MVSMNILERVQNIEGCKAEITEKSGSNGGLAYRGALDPTLIPRIEE